MDIIPHPKIPDRNDSQLNSKVVETIFERWGKPTLDLFATSKTKQAPFYYRKPSDYLMADGCMGEDSFLVPWDYQELVYANPPWKLLPKVIKKVRKDQTKRMIIISPENTKTLRELSIDTPIRLKHSNLYSPPSRQETELGSAGNSHGKSAWAFLISGTPKAIVPRRTVSDSRFLFSAKVNDSKPCVVLKDTGCTAMVISEDFVRKHKIPTYPVDACQFTFGNKSTDISCRGVTIELCKDEYKCKVECYVTTIKQDLILGTPWLETIIVKHLNWSIYLPR